MENVCLPGSCRIEFSPGSPEPVAYAAEQLAAYLEKAGVRCGARAENGGPAAVIRLAVCDDGLPEGAFRRTVRADEVRIEAASGAGAVYGAFAFLEALGFRFLAPDCDVVPAALLPLAPGVTEETPAFAARELFWREAADGDFAVRLRLNTARSSITRRQGGKLMFHNFSHSFDALVPAAKWFDTHPEYFSEVNGVRVREKTQLCLSNPDVLRLCIDGVRRWMREDPDARVFSVSMNDWYTPCTCPACRRIDEEEDSQAGSVVRFLNAVSDAVTADRPDVMLHTFAYLYCRRPPRKTRPRPNVIIRLCSIECCFSHPIADCGAERGGIDVQNGTARDFSAHGDDEGAFLRDLRGWSAVCPNLWIWDYTTNYANYLLPFPNLRVLQANLRLFREFGAKGVLEQGNFSLGRSSALGQLKIYLLGKLLWDPEQDTAALTDEFVRGYYGPAAAPMRAYVRLWENAAGPHHAGIYDTPRAAYLTDALLDEAAGLLRQALACAKAGSPYFERVEREALSVRYAVLAREEPSLPGHAAAVDRLMEDARRLGITELFERKELAASGELLKKQRYVLDRTAVPSISYPL